MSLISREVHLKSRPVGEPADTDFVIVEKTIDPPGEGEVLVQNIYMSVDPYMRGRMREAWDLDRVLQGAAVGRVIKSHNKHFQEGTYVTSSKSWREYFKSDGTNISPIDPGLAPVSAYLGIMGMPGLTAYGGLLITGQLREGETVFVSAASGAVGSVAGQIARIKNCRVIGSAGSDKKVSHLLQEYHFDHAFNYRTSDILEELKQGAPKGLDVYFENVGGAHLQAAIACMRPYGRIPVCGMIAHYNDSGIPTPGPTNLSTIIYNRVTLRGFTVNEFLDKQPQFLHDMSSWLRDGKIKYQETVFEGIDSAVEAFRGLFSGVNDGKMLVKLVDE
jgi:NADPH-dependent curcumin reductase CurA